MLYISLSLFSQKHDYIWLPGKGKIAEYSFNGVFYPWGGVTMDFNTFPPSVQRQDLALRMYAQAIISDKDGRLVAYTNGCHIVNKNHEIMDNGDTINPGLYHTGTQQCNIYYPTYQGTIFLPDPGNEDRYYLFHMALSRLAPNLPLAGNRYYYSLIDAKANNGAGKVIDKNHLIYKDGTIGGYVTATKHANGRDWWVMSPQAFSNKYFVFLLTPEGVQPPIEQFAGDTLRKSNCCGWTLFSPNGERYFRGTSQNGIQIFDFDRCTGALSNPFFIDSSEVSKFGPSGLAVSNDNRYLYASTSKYVWQFDLEADDIIGSKVLLDSIDYIPNPEIGSFLHSLLAPDGKIYMVSLNYVPDMSVIHFPERPGAASQVVQHGYALPALYGNDFIFNFPHYRLGPLDGSACDTLGLDNIPLAQFRWDFEDTLLPLQVSFTEVCSYEPTAWHWDFGDGTTSSKRYPVHTYDSSGIYLVCLRVSNANGADTLCKTLYLGVSAVENPALQSQIEVLPNPFAERLAVLWSAELPGAVFRLYDLMGSVVRTTRMVVGVNELDTDDLPAGAYFWTVEAGGVRLKSGKAVKLR